jgi:hypothetical protein
MRMNNVHGGDEGPVGDPSQAAPDEDIVGIGSVNLTV